MKQLILLLLLGMFTLGNAQTESLEEKIKAAQKIASEFLDQEKVPGLSISVSQHGKLLWSEGFGYANIETKEPVTPNNTLFRIASISKSLTALGIGLLMDKNILDLDASLYTYIPDFPEKKYEFTVRQIGGHIAGIRHYNNNEFLLNKKMTIVEGLDIFKNDPLQFEPGTRYRYSTYGWNLLSVVVQNASKKDFILFMKEDVFMALGMSHTQIDIPEQKTPNRTQFYGIKNNEFVLGPEVNNEFKAAGGGFLSTSEDLIKFGNEIIAPKLVSINSLNELLKSQELTSGKKTNYGVGFGLRHTKNNTIIYRHSGGGIGASALLLIYPEEGVVISILTNRSNVSTNTLSKNLERLFVL